MGRFGEFLLSVVGVARDSLRLLSIQDSGHSMDSIKEEKQIDSGVQQHNGIEGSRDRASPVIIPEQSKEDISSCVLLFGSFLLVFNTWCVKPSYVIKAKADMRINKIGAC